MTTARKRLGLETECNGQVNVALSGCVPVPNRPVRALGISTSKGRSLKGLHSRRDSALQVVGRSNVHAAEIRASVTHSTRWGDGLQAGAAQHPGRRITP